jgi:hypothetical protein
MAQLEQASDALRAPNETLSRVVQGAHQTIDHLAERAAPKVRRLQDGAHHVREVGDEWVENARERVRDRPLTALFAALACGVLVARLLR